MTGGTSKIGLLDTAGCAGNNARNWTGSRHVPIRDHRSCACRPRVSRLRDARACAAGAAGRHRADPRHARPDRDADAPQHAPRERADRACAAHLAAARRPARQARRSRAAPCRCRRAAEGARRRACAARNRRSGDCGRARAADAAAQRTRFRGQAGAAAAGARHAARRNALGPAPVGLRGDHVPQVAECARSVFLARCRDGAAGLWRAPCQVRAGLDRLRARSGRPGAHHLRGDRACRAADLRHRLHPLVAAAGLHRADRRRATAWRSPRSRCSCAAR